MNAYSIEKRIAICKECPIYLNGRCNSNLWINPDTNAVSTTAKIGYVRGCNCYIEVKARNQNNHCIAGKW
jgi:hypothetical protein